MGSTSGTTTTSGSKASPPATPFTPGAWCSTSCPPKRKLRDLEAAVAVLELLARAAGARCVARHADKELRIDRSQPRIGLGHVAAKACQRTRRRKGPADRAGHL